MADLPGRPRLPAHYAVWVEPPAGPAGEETLYLRSPRRQVRLSGHGLGRLHAAVLPLLDGRHTLAEIEAAAAPHLPPEAVRAGLRLLAEHALLEEGASDPLPAATRARLAPQLAFFGDLGLDPAAAQSRLARATVAVLGLGGLGAAAALTLAASGVGTLRLADAAPLTPADLALTPALAGTPPGLTRAEAVAARLAPTYPENDVAPLIAPLADDLAVAAAIAGSDFVVAAVEPGSALLYRLNRLALALGLPWSHAAATGLEGVVGPTVRPGETACYVCYTMRAALAAADPRDEYAYFRYLDRSTRDGASATPGQQHAFAAAAIGPLLALEAAKTLLGLAPSALGALVVLDLLHLTTTRHTILPRPDCPVCRPRPTPTTHRPRT